MEQCAVCQKALTTFGSSDQNTFHGSVSKERSVVSGRKSRNSDDIGQSPVDFRMLLHCRHRLCVDCLRQAVDKQLKTGNALKSCPVSVRFCQLPLVSRIQYSKTRTLLKQQDDGFVHLHNPNTAVVFCS
jgi:hypothetical protein